MATSPMPVTDVFARRIRDARKARGFTQQQLADRLALIGHPMDRATIVKIEAGGSTRARNLTVVDLLAIAYALDVAPVWLMLPTDDSEVAITSRIWLSALAARNWVAGMSLPLFQTRWGRGDAKRAAEVFGEPFERRAQVFRAQRGIAELRAFEHAGVAHLLQRAHGLVAEAAEGDRDGMRVELEEIRDETLRQLAALDREAR